MCSNLSVNLCKLPLPSRRVEERSEVKPVVIRAVVLRVARRSEDSQLVTVHRVRAEEMLHFVRYLSIIDTHHTRAHTHPHTLNGNYHLLLVALKFI